MSPSARGDNKLIAIGAVPRADLLPPELKAEVKRRAQRRLMGGIVILAVVLVVGGYLYATVQAAANGLRLEASNATTQTLAEQKGQYVEVTQAQTQVGKNEAAQIVGVSSEINWRKYLLLVAESLPAGTLLGSVSAKTTAPGQIIDLPTEPLLQPSIASIGFVATSPSLPDVSQWIENLAKIPGFANASASSISFNDEKGVYEVAILLSLNEEALESRFLDSGDDGDEDSQETEETTP